jgi:hypothetical protein
VAPLDLWGARASFDPPPGSGDSIAASRAIPRALREADGGRTSRARFR